MPAWPLPHLSYIWVPGHLQQRLPPAPQALEPLSRGTQGFLVAPEWVLLGSLLLPVPEYLLRLVLVGTVAG